MSSKHSPCAVSQERQFTSLVRRPPWEATSPKQNVARQLVSTFNMVLIAADVEKPSKS